MEQQVKTKVQFTDDYSSFTNLENNDSLSTGFGKIHYDLGYLKSEDQRQESEINAIAQAGSKNICPIGTETHNNQIGFGTEYSFLMPEGAYIISLTGTMVAPIQFNVYSESGTRIALVDIHTIEEAESGVRFVLNDNATKCKFWYDTSDNYILSNIMIRDASITDNTYQPYSPTNRQLYDLVNEKQDSLTFDGTYDSDLNPVATVSTVSNSINDLDVSSVGGAGQYISAIKEINGKIEATPITFDTALSSSSTNNNAPTSKAVYDDQQRQEVEIGAVANRGAKNFLKFRDNVPSASAGNVYANINADGTLSVGLTSGTTATAQLVFTLGSITNYRDRKLILSGCPAGGNYQSGYALYISNDGSTAQADTGSGATIPIVTGVTSSVVALMVRSGTTISSELTFRPMVRDASITDSTFVPYAKTNVELTNENVSQQSEINYAVNTGVKNLLKITGTTASSNGIKYTVNQDGTVTVTGTATANSFFMVGSLSGYTGDIILTGCPADGGYQKWRLFKEGSDPSQSDTGNGMTYTLDGTSGIYMIEIYNGQGFTDANPLIFRPMIRPAAITDPKFVPYALPNPTLTPAAIKVVDEGAKNIADFTSATKTTYTTATFHGVTITRNGDIFTVSGTSDTNGNAFFNIYYEGSTTTKIIPPGNWVALIEDYTGSVVKDIAIQIAAPAVPPAKPYGTPVKFSLSGSESGNWLRVNLRPSTTYNGSFRLMICSQKDYAISSAFVPYALPNPVITPAAIKVVDEGAKNLVAWDISTVRSLNPNATWTSDDTCVKGGITYKFNTDGTIVANGTADTSASKYIKLKSNFSVTNGLIASCGLPAVSQDQSKGLLQLDYPTGSDLNVYDYEESKEVNRDGTVELYIAVSGGITVSNLIFKPMICTAADWAISKKFVPYAMSNVELTEQVDFLRGKMVYSTVRNSSYTSTYTMDTNDFNGSQVGLYLIYIVNWSTTPSISLYAMAYSGNITSQSTLSKIFGSDVSISLSGATVTYAGAGKIQIVAVR